MASNRFLVSCESFYSIQGEGRSMGVPSVFLRLSGCNLRCSGFTYQDPKTGEHLGCDSKLLWLTGKRFSFVEITDYWEKKGWIAKLAMGAHLVITGGEPLLQQTALIPFLRHLDECIPTPVFIEMETNGSLFPSLDLCERVNQFNVSPKLAHSGESPVDALNEKALKQLLTTKKSLFKFVVANPKDINEILQNYVLPLDIPRHQVWLMPEGGTKASINEKKPWLVELCKAHTFNFTTRLQIDIWDEVVGV